MSFYFTTVLLNLEFASGAVKKQMYSSISYSSYVMWQELYQEFSLLSEIYARTVCYFTADVSADEILTLFHKSD